MKNVFKIIGIILALVLLIWGAINVAKFAIYGEYYSLESNVATNPGLNDGFVCQGICASEDNGVILVCGYMDDKSNSRIYVIDLESDESYFVNLERDGKKYTGHAGGIATNGDTVYLANGSKLYVFNLSEILTAKNGETVDIGSGVSVNNAASYVFCDENYIYVGEFHHTADGYDKEHALDDGKTKINAIVSRYKHDTIKNHNGDDAAIPDRIYSVRDKVQGICFTPGGNVVLSTSYGRFSSSTYYVYNEADIKESGSTLDGVPVYLLGDCTSEFKGPAMSEDLDYYNGQVITFTEVASNKYFYGKLFFADDIDGLDIE